MKSNKNLLYAIIGILFVAMNVIIFVLPFKHDGSFWTGYAFFVTAFVLAFGVVLYIVYASRKIDDIFLRFPISTYTYGFLVLELILNLIIMAIPSFSIRIAVLFNVIIIAIFMIIIIANMMTVNHTETVEINVKEKKEYIKTLIMDIKECENETTNPLILKSLRSLEETVKYSDPMSNDSLIPLEQQVVAQVNQIHVLLKDGQEDAVYDCIKKAADLMASRNQKCRVLK